MLRASFALLVVACCAGGILAQSLVRDINTQTVQAGSRIDHAIASGANVFFVADRGLGAEVFVSDGTAAGTRALRDLLPRPIGSEPRLVADFDGAGTILFVADDGIRGAELWRSDGTGSGTRFVADVNPGVAGSRPDDFWRIGTDWFFSAEHSTFGRELWKTDGTSAGTVLVRDFHPGVGDGVASAAVELHGIYVLSVNDGVSGFEPWVTDGTAAGSNRVADLVPGAGSSRPRDFTVANGVIFFAATNGTSEELWVTSGSVTGTHRVLDLAPFGPSASIGSMADQGGALVFAAAESLWTSDGTRTGTAPIAGPNLVVGGGLVGFAGRTYFRGGLGAVDSLWVTDATGSGTRPVTPATVVVPPRADDPMAFGNLLLFSATGSTGGLELWSFDGANAALVEDIRLGLAGSDLQLLASVPGLGLFLRADDGLHGDEFWSTLGLPGTTSLVADVHAGVGSDSTVTELTPHEGWVYFAASGLTTGREIWRTDGTAAGTQLVVDLAPGPDSAYPTALTSFRGDLLFHAWDGASFGFWRWDGSTATRISGLRRHDDESANLGGRLYFGAFDASGRGVELWTTDGTSTGTFELANLNAASSYPRDLLAVGDRLFFSADGTGAGRELYVSDGTRAGTRLVADIWPGATGSDPVELTELAGLVYFVADDGVSGRELWVSDGTAVGTRRVHDITPGLNRRGPSGLLAWRDRLYFRADDGIYGSELWSSDGTVTGTAMVLDANPGALGSRMTPRLGVDEFIYLIGDLPPSGTELWRSDGTAGGTWLVTEINRGPGDAELVEIIGIGAGPQVLFAALDVNDDRELWTSNGRAAETVRVADLNLFGSSSPERFMLAGRTIYFRAFEQATGLELWSMDVAVIGASVVEAYGSPCFGLLPATPTLSAPRAPRLGESEFELAIADAQPIAAAALLLSGRRQVTPLGGGCELLVGSVFATAAGSTNGAGGVEWRLPITRDPVLLGIGICAQGAFADPQGALGVAGLTAGLHLVIGS